MQERQAHWNGVYGAHDEDALTWFESVPEQSIELIRDSVKPGDPVIDVGAGSSRLVDSLLDDELGPVTVLDVSEKALKTTRARLGTKADRVEWVVADITKWQSTQTFALWHDRAVFHFLTDRDDRDAYVRTMHEALRPKGIAIIATFAEDGPEKCSGLPVVRYSPDTLAQTLEELVPGGFEPVESRRHVHITPKGNRQAFQISVFRKTA